MIPIPSIILREALDGKRTGVLDGINRVLLTGKILRRTKGASILYDSFCGLYVYSRNEEVCSEIDASIKGNYLVKIVCVVVKHPRFYLQAISVQKISFQEEMYRTLEAIEYWSIILSQKQPKHNLGQQTENSI